MLQRYIRVAIGHRLLSTAVATTELRVPVPHGVIAAKVWGSPEAVTGASPSRRILAVHGWQDNANSFDPLVRHPDQGLHTLLNPNGENEGMCVIAIDLSGHGLSSHLRPGSIYTHHQYVMDINAVANHLKWENFSLLGHSLGCGVSFYYSLLNPKRVTKLVSFDGSFPFWQSGSRFELGIETAYRTQEKLNTEFIENRVRPPKVWTIDEYFDAIRVYNEKFHPETPDGSASRENTLLLLERGSSPAPGGGFVLNRDAKALCFFVEMSGSSQLMNYLHRFDNTEFRMLVFQPDKGMRMFQDTFDILAVEAKKHMTSYEVVPVLDASHHVHMNQPEKILPKLIDFLLQS